MDTQILEDIGLSKREISIYVNLLEIGTSGAGEILKKSNIQNSVFHFCINRLIEKGLVSYVKKGKTKLYKAATPKTFLSYLKLKEDQLKVLLPKLEEKQKQEKEKDDVEIFEGFRGITTAMNILIDNAKRGDEFLIFALNIENQNKKIQDFYKKFGAKRIAMGIKTKVIAPVELKEHLKSRKDMKIKYSNLPTPSNIGICNNKMMMVSWGDNPKCLLIESKSIVEKQKEFFYEYWKKLK